MSDEKIRKLQKQIQNNPDNFLAWGKYLTEAARINLFDPYDLHTLIFWLHGLQRPVFSQENYAEQEEAWNAAYNQTELLLHNIRNAYGQWDAKRFKEHIDTVFPKLFNEVSWTTLVINSRELFDVSFPICQIDGQMYITYDELGHDGRNPPHIMSRGLTNRPSGVRHATWLRSLIEFEPQYLLQIEKHYPGSYHNPPDWDIVDLETSKDPHEICEAIIKWHLNNIGEGIADMLYAEQMEEDEKLAEEYWNSQVLPPQDEDEDDY